MVCGSIAAHDQDNITVFEVDPVIGHCAAPERLCQSRNSGAVSYSGLVFDVNEPKRPHHRLQRPAFLVVQGGASDVSNGLNSVDHLPFVVLFDEIGVSRGLDSLGDLRDGPVPGLFLPFVTVGGPVQDLGQTGWDCAAWSERRRPLGAQGPFIDGVVGISFDVDDLSWLWCRCCRSGRILPHSKDRSRWSAWRSSSCRSSSVHRHRPLPVPRSSPNDERPTPAPTTPEMMRNSRRLTSMLRTSFLFAQIDISNGIKSDILTS